MKHFLNDQLHWVALGVGILALSSGISISLWLLQRYDTPASTPVVVEVSPSQLQTGMELPGSPVQNTASDDRSVDTSSSADDSMMTGSNEPGAGPAGSGLPADAAVVGGSSGVDDTPAGSAAMEIQPAEAPLPLGGPGENASVEDGADLVVRDASGNIKQQITAK